MASLSTTDIKYMRRALELARRGWGTTHPNPMVGAVVVDSDKIVGEGYHEKAGGPHAEVRALNQIENTLSSQACLYVTLEPCSTQGRTPPCTEAIIKAGIKRVVIGAIDPYLQHRGLGVEIIRRQGVEVLSGVLEKECEDLNLIFNFRVRRERPLFAGKAATTLDGRVATRSGSSQWITGERAREDVMDWRRLFPAIAVGSGTVLADDPRLTSRRNGEVWCPIRFVFDTRMRTVREPLPSVYTDEFRDNTFVVTGESSDPSLKSRLSESGIKGWTLPEAEGGVSLTDFRRRCVENGIEGVYFEGGSRLLSSLLENRELDYLFSYRSPLFFADERALPMFVGQQPLEVGAGFRLDQVEHAVLGADQLIRGFVTYPNEEPCYRVQK